MFIKYKPVLLLIILISFFVKNSRAQQSADTLVIGKYKFPLLKTKTNYYGYQHGTINLPIEYKELKKELQAPYKLFSDSVSYHEIDLNGNEYLIRKIEKKVQKEGSYIYLSSFLDTIKIKAEGMKDLKPYIKRNTEKIYFSAIKMLHYNNAIISEYYSPHITDGRLFQIFGFTDSDFQKHKNSSFIITNLYYRKGLSTFYFNRQFIILLI